MSVQGCREGSFPTFLLPLHIFRYDELRKDGIDDEIHSENIPCAPYAGLVDHRVCMQAGAQAFLRGLCAALHPFRRGRHLSLCERLHSERLHRSGDCLSALALRTVPAGGQAHSPVYRHTDAAQRKNLRFMEEF